MNLNFLRIFFLLVCSLIPTLLLGQSANHTFTFKQNFEPDKEYRSVMTMKGVSSVTYEAPPEMMEKINARGISLPIKGYQEQSHTVLITTGPMQNDSTFTFEQRFLDIRNHYELNGEKMEKDSRSLLSEQTVINGSFDAGNELTITEIRNDSISDAQKETVIKMMSDLQSSIAFPDTALGIGDSFIQEVPLSLPMENAGRMDINMVMTYTLEEIDDKTAYFDISMTMKLDSDIDPVNIKAEGRGTGKAIYDMQLNFSTEYTLNSTMNMEMQSGPITIFNEMNLTAIHNTTITNLE